MTSPENNSPTVLDNFIDEEIFRVIQDHMCGEDFEWFYNDCVNVDGDGNFQFIHVFFHYERGGVTSKFYPLIEPILYKLGVKKLLRVKANLNTREMYNRTYGMHIDYSDVRTAVFYLNTNNGGTIFTLKNGSQKIVESVENRVAIFDSNTQHSGISCTDEKKRVVLNINYTT